MKSPTFGPVANCVSFRKGKFCFSGISPVAALVEFVRFSGLGLLLIVFSMFLRLLSNLGKSHVDPLGN
jgi:hypothetical protein